MFTLEEHSRNYRKMEWGRGHSWQYDQECEGTKRQKWFWKKLEMKDIEEISDTNNVCPRGRDQNKWKTIL